MNSIIERITGKKGKAVREGVPVPCAVVPRAAQRSRMDRLRKRRDPDGIENDNEVEESSMISRVLGEASGEVIPQDAEELDAGNATITTKLRDVKDVVQEPSYPSGEKEKYLTPYAALTAPDATPDSMKPLDPSDVPGSLEGREFKTSDLSQHPGSQEQVMPQPTANAMDVLLGRRGPGAAAAKPGEDLSTPVMTEEAAARVFMASAPEELVGKQMPEHKAGTGTEILSAFRRING
jgi:hypothetical protein